MKNNLLIIPIILLLLSSCEKRYEEVEIDSAIEIQMRPDFDNPSNKIVLSCETERSYPCSNYSLKRKVNNFFGNINIEFKYVIMPNIGSTSFGPATTSINLGNLSNGNHNFETIVNGDISSGELKVTDECYILHIENPNQILIVNDTLNKIPKNTIWGSVCYHQETSESMANTFLDSLETIGATESLYLPGDYYSFNIQENGRIYDEPVNGYWFSKRFIFSYDDDTKTIEDLIFRYKENYSEQLSISLNTSDGKCFRN